MIRREPRFPGRWARAELRALLPLGCAVGSAFVAGPRALHAQDVTIDVVEPNDPGAASQWYLADGPASIGAHTAWAMLRDAPKEPVTVAVIDTNIELWNKDFDDRLVTGWDARNQMAYGNGYLIGSSLHGTFVAGTLLAKTGNAYLGAGVAGELPVRLMPLKYVNEDDLCATGLKPGVEPAATRAFAEAMTYALDHGARVINVSSGVQMSSEDARAFEPLMRRAAQQGVLVVAAAGNLDLDARRLATENVVGVTLRDMSVTPSADTCSNAGKTTGLRYEHDLMPAELELWRAGRTDQVTIGGNTYERSVATVFARGTKAYPAAFGEAPFGYTNVIGVSGSNQDGQRWMESCSFPDGRPVICGGATYGAHASIVAPAKNVVAYSGFGLQMAQQGTSFATPMVSAAAAMVWTVRPELTAEQVVGALERGTDVLAIESGTPASSDVLYLPRVLEAVGFVNPVAPRRHGNLSAPVWDAARRTDVLTDDVSYDPDGNILERTWDFGDGSRTTVPGDVETVSHAYAYQGTYPVTLTVRDDDGNTFTFTQKLAAHGSARDQVTIRLDGPSPYVLDGSLEGGNIVNAVWVPNRYTMKGTATMASPSGVVSVEVDLKTGWFGSTPRGTLTVRDPVRGTFTVTLTSGTLTHDKATDTMTFGQSGLSGAFSGVTVTVRDNDD